MTEYSNHTQNLADVAECARRASAAGCVFLALPECFSFIGASPDETIAQAIVMNYFMFFFIVIVTKRKEKEKLEASHFTDRFSEV